MHQSCKPLEKALWKYLLTLAIVFSSHLYGEFDHHPVSTRNPEAQKSFDEGLGNIFAFNHDLAYLEFEKAAKYDPNLAMAYWGMALALGQNINSEITPERAQKAYEHIQTALKLLPEASANEQAYIKALATRYSNDPKANLMTLRQNYREAMKKLVYEYYEDLDAAALYAESILNLHPWDYWTWDGKPKEGIIEAIDVIESILKKSPYHVGANHYNIHAWEASPYPERALLSAYRLTTLQPESGHLLHMPAHIFIQLGYYEEAIKTSKNAIAADKQYIAHYGTKGEYAFHYYSHNLAVLIHTYRMAEDYQNALSTAMELVQLAKAHPEASASVFTAPLEVYLYFHRWQDILDYKWTPMKSHYAEAYWHFSRALAYLNLGQIEAAEQEKFQMQQERLHFSEEEIIANNPSTDVFRLAELLLNAAFFQYEGRNEKYLEFLQEAVKLQDRLVYNEPPAWYVPLRVPLGKAYFQLERYTEAIHTFKDGLEALPRNGRLLFGLSLALKAKGQGWNTFWVQREAASALRNASPPLTLKDL